MGNVNKILLVVFFILLTITLGEVGWYYYTSTKTITLPAKTEETKGYLNKDPNSYVCQTYLTPFPNKKLGAIHPKYITMLSKYNASTGRTARLLFEEKGRAKDLSVQGKTKNGKAYEIAFNLVYEDGKTSTRYYYAKDSKFTVHNGKGEQIDASTIKEDDHITITTEENPFEDPTITQAIVKIIITVDR